MEAFNRWRFRETLPDDAHKKVSKCFRGARCELNFGFFC